MTLTAIMLTLIISAGPGEKAPPINAPDLAGTVIQLEKYKGQVVLVDFWATWCKPCRASLPHYSRMQRTHGPKGFTVLGVSVDKNRANVMDFIKKNRLGIFVIHDKDSQIVGRYNPPAMPTAYLIGRDGRIRMVHRGFKSGDAKILERAVVAAMGGK